MNAAVRILLVEDAPADAELTERELLKSLGRCEFQLVETKRDFVDALEKFAPDLVLADYYLPEFSGLEALKLILERQLLTPVIIITGLSNEEMAVECMKAGAADYILKDNLRRLGPAVERALKDKKVRLERNQAYGMLQRNEKQYRITLDNMLEGCQIIDFDWRYIYINKSAEIQNRRSSQELLGKKYTDVWPGIESTELYRLLKHCMEKRAYIRSQAVFTFPDKTTGWFEVSLQPIPEGIFIVSAEISEQKQAEASLEFFRSLIDQSPDAIEVVDLESTRLVDANEVAWESLGYSREEFLSLHFNDIVPSETLATKVTENLRKKDHIVLEGMHRRKDGTTFPVELHIRSAHLDRTYQVIIARDITLHRQAQDTLHRQNRELARLYRASESLLIGGSVNLMEQALTIVSVVQKEFGQSTCSLILTQKGINDLKRLVTVGPSSDEVRDKVIRLDEPGIIAEVIRSGKVINIRDLQEAHDSLPEGEAARSELCIPLQVGAEVIGAIDVQSVDIGAFNGDDERMMSIFCERAALALERSRLNAQTESRLRQLLSLRTIDMAITSSFDMNFTLNILLDQLVEQSNIHAADILVYSSRSQTLQVYAERGFHTPVRLHSYGLFHTSLGRRAIHERAVVEIHDLEKMPRDYLRSDDFSKEGFQSYLGVPVIAKGQVKGVLELFQRGPLELTPEQRSFAEMLAGQAAIAIDNAQLFESIQSYNADLMMAYDETIAGWSQAMDLRDKETEGHSRRVTDGTVLLATSLQLRPEELVHIRRGALLHDIGKLGIPDEILRKPSALTEPEWAIMRKHPQFAYDMLVPIRYLHPALDIPYCHHEKWNGTGYPRNLKGDQIPLAARIFAVVDVWDALTSDRPYRRAWSKEESISYIRDQSGKHFDPEIVQKFLEDGINAL